MPELFSSPISSIKNIFSHVMEKDIQAKHWANKTFDYFSKYNKGVFQKEVNYIGEGVFRFIQGIIRFNQALKLLEEMEVPVDNKKETLNLLFKNRNYKEVNLSSYRQASKTPLQIKDFSTYTHKEIKVKLKQNGEFSSIKVYLRDKHIMTMKKIKSGHFNDIHRIIKFLLSHPHYLDLYQFRKLRLSKLDGNHHAFSMFEFGNEIDHEEFDFLRRKNILGGSYKINHAKEYGEELLNHIEGVFLFEDSKLLSESQKELLYKIGRIDKNYKTFSLQTKFCQNFLKD